MGTPDYVAPEVVDPDIHLLTDLRPTDMFSLGVTIVFMVSGVYPWVDFRRDSGNIRTNVINKQTARDYRLYDIAMNLVGKNPNNRLTAWDTYILLTGDDPNNILPDDLQGKQAIYEYKYPEGISAGLLTALRDAKYAAKSAAKSAARGAMALQGLGGLGEGRGGFGDDDAMRGGEAWW